MKRLGPLFTLILTALVCWLVAITFARAQHVEYDEMLSMNAAVGAATVGTTMRVDAYTTLAAEVTITGTATLRIDTSADPDLFGSGSIVCVQSNDTTPRTALLNITATGLYQCQLAGAQTVRPRISAYTDGTVTVFFRATTAKYRGKIG